MKSFVHIGTGFFLLAGGIYAGKQMSRMDIFGKAPQFPGNHPVKERDLTKKAQKNSEHTLEALRSQKRTSKDSSDLSAALERMDVSALRNLVSELGMQLAEIDDHRQERNAKSNLRTLAVAELWRRGGLASMEWAINLEPLSSRWTVTGFFLERAFETDPDTALHWLNRSEVGALGNHRRAEFESIALRGAIERGADEVIRIYQIFEGSMMDIPTRDLEFPENFDFGKLHAALGTKVGMGGVIAQWVHRDRDAAAAAVLSSRDLKEYEHFRRDVEVACLMSGAIHRDGIAEGVRWMLGVLEEHGTIREDVPMILGIGFSFSPEVITALLPHTTPEQRKSIASISIAREGLSPSTHAMLGSLPREDLLSTLNEYFITEASSKGAVFKQRRIDDVQRRYQLSTSEIDLINTPQSDGEK